MNKECIFCKIVNGEIKANVVYEDLDVIAFLDINQTTKGHTLVIPKDHHETFLSAPREVMHRVMDVAQRIGQAQMKQLLARGVNIIVNNYPSAGQIIPHFHVHVIPRYDKTDGLSIEMLEKTNPDFNLPVVASEIRKGL